MNRELSEGNIECLRFFEFKSPAILYDDSLSYKESSLQDSSLKFNDKCELSLPNTKNIGMSEKKISKKRFAKKENFDILKIDTNLFSYELTFKTPRSTTKIVISVKVLRTMFYVIRYL